MVLVALTCALVGDAGVFGVKIDDSAQVWELKEAIKGKNLATITCDAKDLQLFLAKQPVGDEGGKEVVPVYRPSAEEMKEESLKWLPDEHRAALKLVKGESDDYIHALTAGEPILGSKTLTTWFYTKNNMELPSSEQIHVLVVVPPPSVGSKRSADEIADVQKRLRLLETDSAAIKPALAAIKPKTLTKFTPFSVHEDEFQLDSLSITQQRDDPIVMTPTLHKFWEGFGEFPSYYFVRVEEVMFWEVIKKQLLGKVRIVIVGSPGVGKSCFLMLIAFYLACIVRKKVLVIRRLKEPNLKNAVVFFDGQGSYARLTNLSPIDIVAIRDQVTPKSVEGEVDIKEAPIVLVDGFNQAEVDDTKNEYAPFHFLATSCQFDAKQDDNSRIVVLPAWRDVDLLQYAKLTDWVTKTGLRKVKQKKTPYSKLVKEQYFYSGGSLREFCKEREQLKRRVVGDCCSVGNAQAFDLVYNYGGGQSKSQVDRLRRHYITDCQKEKHYYDHTWWKLSVDSGYVLSKLGRIVDTNKQLEIYKYAKSVGAGFHGVAYEQLLHNAVRGAFVKRKPIVLKMREGSKYEKIEIRVANVVCSGENEESCYRCLSTLGKDTYWYPDYPFFPFIDAVTTCEAFPSKGGSDEEGHNLSTKSETIVAYIQVTIRSEKTFKEKRLCRLNEELDKNTSLKNMKRAFVVVGPDSGICKMFDLKGAPDANTFLTMISCFNPEQLERELS